MPDAAESIKKVMSDVLTNRNPPYGIRGGLFDALADTRGLMYGITNAAGHKAEKLIQDTLGIDPDPAAAIASPCVPPGIKYDSTFAIFTWVFTDDNESSGSRNAPRNTVPPRNPSSA